MVISAIKPGQSTHRYYNSSNYAIDIDTYEGVIDSQEDTKSFLRRRTTATTGVFLALTACEQQSKITEGTVYQKEHTKGEKSFLITPKRGNGRDGAMRRNEDCILLKTLILWSSPRFSIPYGVR